MGEVLLDAFIDSLKLFAVVAAFTFFIALIEPKLSKVVKFKGKLAPLLGVSISLLPQCGFSVVATDLYQKRHITVGTLIGVFIATSDEALPVFLSYPSKALHILPILAIKFVIGLLLAYLIDFILKDKRKSVEHHLSHCSEQYQIRLSHCESAELVAENDNVDECDCDECRSSECHHHNLNMQHSEGILADYAEKKRIQVAKKQKLDRFLISPLSHSIEIFLYAFVINIVFGTILYYVGRENIIEFLISNKYLAPLFAVIIGAIPNCTSSIILSELYIMGGLGFGATLGGLMINAGLAFTLLFKKKKFLKEGLMIFAAMFFISLAFSYVFSFAFSFGQLSI